MSPKSHTHYSPAPPVRSKQITMVPEQLCHLVLDQATEAMIATEGGHSSSHMLIFCVQDAKAESRHPKVLREDA